MLYAAIRPKTAGFAIIARSMSRLASSRSWKRSRVGKGSGPSTTTSARRTKDAADPVPRRLTMAPTGSAGPRRLDRRVQGQQVGLGRDVGDALRDAADLLDVPHQRRDAFLSLGALLGRALRRLRCAGDLARDFVDRGGEMLRRSRDALDVLLRLLRRVGDGGAFGGDDLGRSRTA